MAVGLAALAGCGSSNNGNGVTCGDGTTQVGDQCVADNGSGGSGSGGGDVTCGSGTVLDGDTCVPAPNDAAAPTITMITPTEAGAYGHQPFEIDGTGFAGDNITDLHVYFGDPTLVDSDGNSICEAFAVVASATTIGGEMPAMCDVNVQVSVVTNLGSATVPFHYDAIFAADGDGGANGWYWTTNVYNGELWVLDPYVGVSLDYGPLAETIVGSDGSDELVYFGGLSGITFDGSGTLWGITTGDSTADFGSNGTANQYSTLVTIDLHDPSGYPMVTPIGSAFDASRRKYFVSDIEWNDGTLYGVGTNIATSTQGLVTIGSNGAVTRLGTGSDTTWVDDWYVNWAQGGLAFDGSGNLWVTPSGAGSDATDGATGAIDTANTTSGALTTSAVLDWGVGSPINSMTNDEGFLYAVIDNGSYGVLADLLEQADGGGQDELFGETLAIIDPTGSAGQYVYPQFELPASTGLNSAVDGIAVLQSTTATLDLAHEKVSRAANWQPLTLRAGAAITRRVRR